MKQIMCTKFTGTAEDNVDVIEVETPSISEEEILIKMIAAPINPADLLLINNRHAYTIQLPSLIGIEGVGKIIDKGKNVEDLQIGDLVAVPFGGTWRQMINKLATEVYLLPKDIDPLQASMLCVNPFTALGLLNGLEKDDWIIQNAANSAIAQMIISIAAQKGIKTINIVRNENSAERLFKLGANEVIIGEDDLTNRVRKITNGKMVKRALDAVAGRSSGVLLECVESFGELWCYGLLSSDDIILPATKVVFGNATVKGFSRLSTVRNKSKIEIQNMVNEIVQLIKQGIISSPIQEIFPIDKAKEAVKLANQEGRSGKIIIDLQ
jgi:mitochondrial enoyl-[acyl-carrier protein] reductase / trans-2-enoyl-CoA reductase